MADNLGGRPMRTCVKCGHSSDLRNEETGRCQKCILYVDGSSLCGCYCEFRRRGSGPLKTLAPTAGRIKALEDAAEVAMSHKSMNRMDAKCMGNCGEVIASEIRALISSTPAKCDCLTRADGIGHLHGFHDDQCPLSTPASID